MKKLYAPQAASELKRSRFSFVKVLSLAAAATFLSNVTPVFSANSDFRNTFLEGVNSAGVSHPQSIISVAGLNASSVSKDNYLTALNKAGLEKINAADDYANFLTRTLPGTSDESSFAIPALESTYKSTGFNNDVTTFNMGPQARVDVNSLLRNTRDSGISVGTNTVTIGSSAQVNMQHGIAIGYKAAVTTTVGGIAIGSSTKSTSGGIALGNKSEAFVGDKIDAYRPFGVMPTPESFLAWRSTESALSIGSVGQGITRQIVGVAGGTQDTDAVNVAQLKALEKAAGSWKLSVSGANTTTVESNKLVDLAAASNNIKVTKGNKDNNVKFDLARSIVIDKIQTGNNTLDATGLVIANGPKITTGGITAGSKKITGVAKGTEGNDAVNLGQLQDLEKVVKNNGWKLSVGDKNATTVLMDSGVDFSAGSSNLNITKGEKDNKLKFDLAKDVTLTSLKTGANTLNATGLVIANGPKITTDGVNAGSKKIIGVATGTEETDAVNFAQLKAAQEAAVIKGLKINTTGKDFADAIADAENSVALGSKTSVSKLSSGALAFGSGAKASVKDSVALGSDSVADRAAGVFGYTPLLQGPATNTSSQWKSTRGAVSVGDYSKGITRQITGVAAGSEVADAVNVRQLRDLEDVVRKNGWKLSAGGANATTVLMDSDVDFSAGSTNLQIAKGDKDNKLKFDLAKDVTLTSLKAGTNTLDATGLVITGGPQITTAGIGAGSKKITGLAKGTDDTDAVNKGQLDENVTTLSKNIEDVRSIAVFYDVEEDTTEEVSTLTRTAPKAKQSSVTFGDPKTGTVALHNVGIGKITADSTDAVNGSQLYSLGSEVAKYFGGGAKYDGGTWTAPTFTVKSVKDDGVSEDKVYSDVASALSGVGSSITNVQNKLTEQVNNVVNKVESESFVQQDKTTHLLTIGAKSEGSEINIANKTGADRTLSGVKDATKNNEAVNKGQLEKGLKDLSNSLQSDESAVVHYDKGSDGKTNYSSVTLGGKDKTAVGLHNVAAGKIAKDSHDAITGGQVNTIGEDVAKFLGGDAAFTNGALTQPTYKLSHIATDGVVTESSFQGVGTAFAGLDTNIKNVNARIKEVSEGVAHDSLNWSKTAHAFVAQHEKREEKDGKVVVTQENSKITSLAAGAITKDSTDAINGSQLHSLGNTVATYFGGSATFADGAFTAPTYKISNVAEDGKATETSYNDVGSAFAGLDTSVKNVNTHLTNEVKKFDDKLTNITQAVQGDALLWNDKSHAFVAQHEKKKKEEDGTVVVTQENSKITSLAAGKITADSTDAINGSQIYSMSEMVGSYFGGGAGYNKEGAWIAPTFKVKQIGSDGHITDETYQNVADAFSSVGNSFQSVHNEINTMRSDSLVKWNEEKKLIKIGGEKDGTTITLADKDSKDRILSGVKDAEKGNEAVNKAQLDKNIDALTNEIEEVRSVAVFYDEEEDTEEVSTLTRTAPKAKQSNVTFGDPKTGPVGLHNVGTGKIAKDSHDAINGSQLFETNDKVATYLGGGSAFKEGSFTAPTYKISNITDNGTVTTSSYNDVGSAFAGLDTSVKNVNTHLMNEVKKFDDKLTNITQAVQGDALLWSKTDKAFVARHEKKEEQADGTVVVTQENSKITSLAAGSISETSTDAVNGSQLHSFGTGVATSLGGGAKYENGQWTAPTFKVKTIKEDGSSGEGDYSDVASAFAGVGSSITNVKNEITKQINNEIANVKGDSLVKQDEKTKVINIGKEVEGSEINIANKTGTDRTLSGVKAATKDNEAVNKGQLEKGLTDLSNSLQSDESAVVHYDKKDDKIDYANITLGGKDKTAVGLHNVADGKIAKDSHDAITGGQVNTIGEDVAKFLGGDAAFTNGALTQPTYKLSHIATDGVVTESSFQGVGTAFAGLDTNIKTVNARIKEVSQGVAHDSLLWNDKFHAFVAQHEKKEEKEDGTVVVTQENSKITSLAAGSISETSTDAVNGSQLHSFGTGVATSLGGGAKYENGQWTAPTFKVKTVKDDGTEEEKKYDTVAEALADVGTSFTNIKNDITNVVSDSLVKFDEKSNLIKIGGEKEGTNISISDKESKDRILSGVKDAEHANEAVNKGQLDENVDALTNEIEEVRSVAVFYDEEEDTEEVSTLTRTAPKAKQSNVTFGDPKTGTVGLHNVGNGNIAEDSHDAVNGSQLHSFGTGVATSLGGGAKYENGQWTAPTFKVKTINEDGSTVEEQSYDSVAEAFAGVGSSFTNIHNEINKEISKVVGDSLVKQDETTKVINIGGEVEGTSITIANKAGADRTLSGVQAATKDNEAVNKGQLDKGLKDLSNSLQSDESAVVHYDKKDDKIDYANVTLGKAKDKTAVGLHNVADGKIAKDSHDAITGGQVNTIGEDVAKFLGGDAAFTNGALTQPTYKLSHIATDGVVTESSFQGVGTAFAGLDTNIKTVNARIKEVSEGVAHDSLLWSDKAHAFVAQHEKREEGDDGKVVVTQENSKITSLAAGSIVSGSSDAVTGGQIYELQKQFAGYFGGGAGYNEKGEWQAPNYNLSSIDKDGKVTDKSHTDVGSAFKGLDDNIKTVNARIKEVSEGVAQDSLSWSKTEGAFVALHGEGDNRKASKITSLAAGSIASGSSDAVNGGQIYSLNQTLAKYFGGDAKYEDDEWSEPTFTLKTYNADGTEGDPQEHHNVTEAFAGIDKNFTNVVNDFKEQVTNITESMQGDALLWNESAKAFVAKHGEKDGEKTNSKITSLAAGSIASGSSDAVNGGQIYDLNQSLAKYFGGDAKYDGDGWVLPGFKLMTFQEDGSFEEEDYDSIAAAFAGINKVFKNLHNEISENIEQNALLWSDDAGAFVAQHEKEGKKDNSKITFLAEGKISEDSTDAINGGQIYTLQQSFASYFGGGAGYDKEGNWQGPKFYVQVFNKDGTKGDKEERNNVSEAFDVVNDSMSTINDRIKEVEKDVASNGLNWNEEKGSYDASHADDQGVKSPSKIINVEDGKVDKDSKEAVNGGQLWETQQMITDQVKDIETKVTDGSVQYDKDETGKKTNTVTLVGGDDSSPVLIDNVADGKIEKDSKEAVNGGQLHDYTEQQMKTVLEDANKYTDEKVSSLVNNGVNEAKSYTDMKFETLNYAIEDVRKEARQAAAIGLAVSNLRYYDIPGSLSVSFGSGLWRSQSAFAIGAGYTSEDGNIRSNVSITSAGGHWGIGAGITLRLR